MNNTALSTKDKSHFESNLRTITSMEVAEMVGKRHTDLIRDIRRYLEQLNESNIASGDELKIDVVEAFYDRRCA